ncbi:MAG: N-acetyltransferase [Sphingopyxis sp.]
MVEIKPLSCIEPIEIEALLDAAFGGDRFQRTAYRLREGAMAIGDLSFAAFCNGRLVGTLQSWPIMHIAENGENRPLIMVGPVAVMPDAQGMGVGRTLMCSLLSAAESAADAALMMIGDPDYYGRFFGFTADATAEWVMPGPVERHRLLARPVNGHLPPAVVGRIVPGCAVP